eukprot:1145905-Pelagomonas_calceolata.AAC.9
MTASLSKGLQGEKAQVRLDCYGLIFRQAAQYAIPPNIQAAKLYKLQWGLTFSQVVWLLGLLNCSNCAKNIHGIGNNTISLISLLLQG